MDAFGLTCLFMLSVLLAVKLAESRGRHKERERYESACQVMASFVMAHGGEMKARYTGNQKYELVWGRDDDDVYARIL